VQVKDHRQRFLGVGFFNSKSKIHVRVLAPECVKEMKKWKQSEETKRGMQWFMKWRTHFARVGIGLENCMGVDFFDRKGSSIY